MRMRSIDLRADVLGRLPPHLGERVWLVSPPAGPAAENVPADGAYVLYWMRTAVRGHENPALDVALSVSALLQRPLFVYHALSERYPYASDRHHRFILEGARDVQAELAARQIGYAFHLERPGHRGPHLRSLAQRACVMVTEDMPWAPLVAWTQSLAASLGRSIVAVDTACVLPARRVGRAWLRAFAFRAATADERLQRACRSWPEVTPTYPEFVPSVPFQPVDLSSADLGALIAGCEIDHSVGPVAHTRGGSDAGYARWQRFLRDGLARYGTQRDDPLQPDASSRMSAYLHYGQVSPLRIARQAAQASCDAESRDKFLDELLTWRELAHVFCTYEPAHETLAAVPDWAKKTLRAHEADPRRLLPSWEQLSRGDTGEPLWDAAQRSLRIHGELHNNLRMTWGKAMLAWTPNAQAALSMLIDLNHRYALDGRDPSSYGGILWCLGQFDRPFPPQRPCLGIVRPRSLREHAKKLSPLAYRAQVLRPAHVRPLRAAIFGDDIAATFCARTLFDHGIAVQILGLGPEAATTQPSMQKMQTAVISDRRLRRYVESWMQGAVLSEVLSSSPAGDQAAHQYLPIGAAGSLAAHLQRGLDQTQIAAWPTLVRRGSQWWLRAQPASVGLFSEPLGELGPFDVILATTNESCDWLQRASAKVDLMDPNAQRTDSAAPVLDFDKARGIGLYRGSASSDRLQDALLAAMALAGRVLDVGEPSSVSLPRQVALPQDGVLPRMSL